MAQEPDPADEFRSAVVRGGLAGEDVQRWTSGVSPRSVGAKKLLTIGAEWPYWSAPAGAGDSLRDVVAVRIDPEGKTDEQVQALADELRHNGVAVRVLPRRKAAALPEGAVARAARRSIREVVAELGEAAPAVGFERAELLDVLEQKLSEAGL